MNESERNQARLIGPALILIFRLIFCMHSLFVRFTFGQICRSLGFGYSDGFEHLSYGVYCWR